MLVAVTDPNPELKPVPIAGRFESEEIEEVTVVDVEDEEKGTEREFLAVSSWFSRWCVSRRLLLAAVRSSAFLSAASFSRLSWASCSGKDSAPPTKVSVVVTGGVAEAVVVTDGERRSSGGEEGRGGREVSGRNWQG